MRGAILLLTALKFVVVTVTYIVCKKLFMEDVVFLFSIFVGIFCGSEKVCFNAVGTFLKTV